jgi:hypothetical protein
MPSDAPHFSFPFRFTSVTERQPDGSELVVDQFVAVEEQNDQAEIMSCVNVITRCPLGFRDERPDYGWPWPDFRTAPIQPGPLEVALMRLEPRASYAFYEYGDVLSQAIRHLQTEVTSTRS